MVGVAIGVAGVASAGASLAGASKQAKSTDKASDSEMAMYDTTRGDLSPYNTYGQDATDQIHTMITGQQQPKYQAVNYQPVVMDQAALEQTPGYQFNLLQGLKATQNSAAARGLGSSGAALKGAASYATGLADSTYQNQFANATTNAQNVYNAGLNNSNNTYNAAVQGQTNSYNRLLGIAQLGESAAAQTGAFGTQTAQSVGQNTIAGGTAQAAGLNGAASSINNGVGNYLQYNALKGLYGSSGATA